MSLNGLEAVLFSSSEVLPARQLAAILGAPRGQRIAALV